MKSYIVIVAIPDRDCQAFLALARLLAALLVSPFPYISSVFCAYSTFSISSSEAFPGKPLDDLEGQHPNPRLWDLAGTHLGLGAREEDAGGYPRPVDPKC